ncbi:hypothetical protein BE221DRAFT_67883 [Ostreococcus tauri]|uniref:Uncharacterized protein n=1 Tax=Ostreococcus tauri TaxID=70448 RepID=A0A1Y5IGM6_OSTTA|nr:hypothetical protein BE221DRAFT_67883 [Ostreococcus tauri]
MSNKYDVSARARAVKLPEIGERRAMIPYWNDEREKTVYVGDEARRAVEARRARDFIALPHEDTSEALRALRETIQSGWTSHESLGCGHASGWPEIFARAEALIREQFPQFGASAEVLPGTGWLGEGNESRAIDWVIRRPEKHIIASKIHFATRLHRDPDSWTNPSTTQRPRDGWPDLSMPDRGRYQYRFINVHLTTSALDPTGNPWQSPLVVMLPKDSGQTEWKFVKRKLEMTPDAAKDENNFSDKINIFDPKTWIIGGNRLTRGAYKKKPTEEDVVEVGVRGEDGMTDAERSFEFPEVLAQDDHEFVTNGALLFDSFDCWHGAAKWQEDKPFRKVLTDVDPKGREPFHSARCSIELRFRVRIDMDADDTRVPWGPFTSAVRSGKFLSEPLRDSEARYDLDVGLAV